jgi:GT2 family glycosyltransferase
MLQRALDAFKAGDYADALLAAEYVCRRYPSNSIPAILRAKILETCSPGLAAKAWYKAWCCAPEKPQLQDLLMATWLHSGAAQSVAELGPAFLPARCRTGTHMSLVAMLRQAGKKVMGACWRASDAIDAIVFATEDPQARVRLVLSDEVREYYYDVPANGVKFRIPLPSPTGVWSVSLAAPKGEPETLLSGSPVVVYDTAPNSRPAKPKAHPTAPPVVLAQSAGTHGPAAQGGTAQRAACTTIIIPVYRDKALVQACLQSVLASQPQNRSNTRIVVIDDCSPEPDLSAWLAALARAKAITLLRNPRNLGFIETVNRGMRVNPNDDALLLNADTVVHGDWVDRLRASLYSSADIASVTPWSNNGEISSFPRIANAAPAPSLKQLAALDATAAKLHAAGEIEDIEVPACCGFTLLMRRSVIDEIGQFDGWELIRGYNEEVDWCMRARGRGYRHLAATGVFVAHVGTVSFRFEKTLRVAQNRATILARHPDYHPEYQAFVAKDGLEAPRKVMQQSLAGEAAQWLASAVVALDGLGEFAKALPGSLPTGARRVAVWNYSADMKSAAKILQLARLLANQAPSARPVRLAIFGPVSNPLWNTGVVDVIPPHPGSSDTTLLSNTAIAGLCGCIEILTESGAATPLGLPQTLLTDSFDPAEWLADRLVGKEPRKRAA